MADSADSSPQPPPPGEEEAVIAKNEDAIAGTSIDPAGQSKPSRPAVSSCEKSPCHAAVAMLSSADVTMSRLNTLLSSSNDLDLTMSVIGYGSHALHHLLASSPSTALRNRLRLLLLHKLRGQTPASSSSSSSSSQSSKPPLLALSKLISETRYALRLFALVSIWTWGSATAKSPPHDRVLRIIAYLEVFSIFVYQALENVAYLASKGIFGKRLVKRWGGIDAWNLWSMRAWFGYVLLELVRLARESVLFRRREEERKKKGLELSETEKQEEEEARRQEIRRWRKSLVNNLAWAPLCAHWSVEKGIGVPDSLTGFISLIAKIWGAYDAWRATAQQ
ncbi:hypothetical protein VTN77DRAFT_5228 [Rasamsonia byssochlamydoides]|uniref:uncharacterized protein n=1 Tax=Rasamsonia byssochlamydoides TaxID=89139 RepID=UPI00374268AB